MDIAPTGIPEMRCSTKGGCIHPGYDRSSLRRPEWRQGNIGRHYSHVHVEFVSPTAGRLVR